MEAAACCWCCLNQTKVERQTKPVFPYVCCVSAFFQVTNLIPTLCLYLFSEEEEEEVLWMCVCVHFEMQIATLGARDARLFFHPRLSFLNLSQAFLAHFSESWGIQKTWIFRKNCPIFLLELILSKIEKNDFGTFSTWVFFWAQSWFFLVFFMRGIKKACKLSR